ncbi:hypothetical protein V6N11_068008 [Hibiscus sabdariffa]|uniref:Uncharacterized protein n=1 Tax=Hibiscus sabdariffa TaxID=183260 RepID=A0ABR2SSF3_9ROSI
MLHTSISRFSCSSLWRALSNAREILLSNLAWSLGNGISDNILSDVWVLALGLLCDFSQVLPVTISQISFASILNDHGEWDISKLSLAFTADAIPYILGVKPPDPHAGPDMCVWRWTDHHDFELKSAYYRRTQSAL